MAWLGAREVGAVGAFAEMVLEPPPLLAAQSAVDGLRHRQLRLVHVSCCSSSLASDRRALKSKVSRADVVVPRTLPWVVASCRADDS